MANTIKFKRGNDAQRTFTPEDGEPLWSSDGKKLYVGDGSTVGGVEVGSGGDYLTTDGDDTKTAGSIKFNDNIATAYGTGADVITYFDGTYLNIDVGNDYDIRMRDQNSSLAERFVFDISSGTLYANTFDGWATNANYATTAGSATTATTAGSAATADKWTTTRTITLTGDVTSSATNIDGSGNISIGTTFIDDPLLSQNDFLKTSGYSQFYDNIPMYFGQDPDAKLNADGTEFNLDMYDNKNFVIRDVNSSNADRFIFDTATGDLDITGDLTATGSDITSASITLSGEVYLSNGTSDTPQIHWHDSTANADRVYIDIAGRAWRMFTYYNGGSVEFPFQLNLDTLVFSGAGKMDMCQSSEDTVGSTGFFMFVDSTNRSAGYTTAGSNLEWAGKGDSTIFSSGTSPSGTWRLHGYHDGSSNDRVSVWQRIV